MKEAHIIQAQSQQNRMMFFCIQLLPEKKYFGLIKLRKIGKWGICFCLFIVTIANKKLYRSIKSIKYMLYKHKPGKRGCYVSSTTTAWKGMKIIQIIEAIDNIAHITKITGCVL